MERFKNEFGEEYGVYRVVGRENDSTYPGLAISRSIGDEDAKKLGVIYEPDVFKYELNSRDKILIIASDGLWEHLSNEEVINIVGNCYCNNVKCEEAANILIENAEKKVNDGKYFLKKISPGNIKKKEEQNYGEKTQKRNN